MKTQLSPERKTECRFILGLIILAIIIKEIAIRNGEKPENNPTIQHIAQVISHYLDRQPENVMQEMLRVVNHERIKVGRRVMKFQLETALLGAMKCVTSGRFKPTEGTHRAYVLDTLFFNARQIESTIGCDIDGASKFYKILDKAMSDI
jgi:hypothetical protein